MTERAGESQKPPEGQELRLVSTENNPAFDARFILGGEALNSQKLDLPEITEANLQKTPDLTPVITASNNERLIWWQQQPEKDFNLQKARWVSEMTHAFAMKKADLTPIEWQRWGAFFQKIGISNHDDFKKEDAENFYNEYFGADGRNSEIGKFNDRIIKEYTDSTSGEVDITALERDLDAEQWIGGTFGRFSSLVTTQTLIAQARIKSPQERKRLVDQLKEEKEIIVNDKPTTLQRINRLNKSEEFLLDILALEGKVYAPDEEEGKEKESPVTPPAPQEDKHPTIIPPAPTPDTTEAPKPPTVSAQPEEHTTQPAAENVAKDLDTLIEFSKKTSLEKQEVYEKSLQEALKLLVGKDGIVTLQDLPTIVIPDLHARREFLAKVMQQEINGVKVYDLLKQGKINVVCVGDGMHSTYPTNWSPSRFETVIDERGMRVNKRGPDGKLIPSPWGIAFELEQNVWNKTREKYRNMHPQATDSEIDKLTRIDPEANAAYITRQEEAKKVNPTLHQEEMTRSLGLMKIVMDLKTQFPENFYFLRGNHDDMAEVIAKYEKSGVQQSTIVKNWVIQNFGQEFLNTWAQFEGALPLVAKGKNFVVSHAAPLKPLTENSIKTRDNSATWQLIWSDNTETNEDELKKAVHPTLIALGMSEDTLWVIGHREPTKKYGSQLNGQLIQVNDGGEYIITYVPNDRKFEPEQDVHVLSKTQQEPISIAATTPEPPSLVENHEALSPQPVAQVEPDRKTAPPHSVPIIEPPVQIRRDQTPPVETKPETVVQGSERIIQITNLKNPLEEINTHLLQSTESHERFHLTPDQLLSYLKTLKFRAGPIEAHIKDDAKVQLVKRGNQQVITAKGTVEALKVGIRFNAELVNDANGRLRVIKHDVKYPIIPIPGLDKKAINEKITNLDAVVTNQINSELPRGWEVDRFHTEGNMVGLSTKKKTV